MYCDSSPFTSTRHVGLVCRCMFAHYRMSSGGVNILARHPQPQWNSYSRPACMPIISEVECFIWMWYPPLHSPLTSPLETLSMHSWESYQVSALPNPSQCNTEFYFITGRFSLKESLQSALLEPLLIHNAVEVSLISEQPGHLNNFRFVTNNADYLFPVIWLTDWRVLHLLSLATDYDLRSMMYVHATPSTVKGIPADLLLIFSYRLQYAEYQGIHSQTCHFIGDSFKTYFLFCS